MSAPSRGDQEAFAAFYDHTHGLVFSLTLHVLRDRAAAEEVTLDVYLQVWRQAASFEAMRGRALTWLTMIARSRAIDRLRASGSALGKLNPAQRQLIETAYYEGLSHTEMAERFGLPLGTVKTRIRGGMIALKKHLAAQ